MADRLKNIKIPCKGGLVENIEVLEQGLIQEVLGTADTLLNYEPSLNGGYELIKGFSKYSSTAVPGNTTAPLLGCKVAHDGVYVSRENVAGTSIDVFYGTGSTWGSKLNASNLGTGTGKHRYTSFSISEPVVILTTGQEHARHFDASQTETVLNTTGCPAAPKYSEMVRNRLVLAPATTTSSIAISAPGDETDFNGASAAAELEIGDVVTGLKRFRDTLYIFCLNSIWSLEGDTSSDFIIRSVTRSIGCVSHDSIQEVGGDLIFLSQDGLRSLAATDRIGDVDLGLLSRQIQPSLNTIASGATEDHVSSCLVSSKSQYRIFINPGTISGDTEAPGFLGRLVGERQYEWAKLEGFNTQTADGTYLSTGTELIIFGHITNGYVYKMESGNSFDSTAIHHIYETPDIMYSDALFRKVMQKLSLYVNMGGDFALNVATLLDFNSTDVLQPKTFQLTHTGENAKYGEALYGTGMYSSVTFKVFKSNLIGSGFQVKFKFSGSSTEPTHRIDALEVQYLEKEQR